MDDRVNELLKLLSDPKRKKELLELRASLVRKGMSEEDAGRYLDEKMLSIQKAAAKEQEVDRTITAVEQHLTPAINELGRRLTDVQREYGKAQFNHYLISIIGSLIDECKMTMAEKRELLCAIITLLEEQQHETQNPHHYHP